MIHFNYGSQPTSGGLGVLPQVEAIGVKLREVERVERGYAIESHLQRRAQAQTSGSRLAPVVKVDHDGMSW